MAGVLGCRWYRLRLRPDSEATLDQAYCVAVRLFVLFLGMFATRSYGEDANH